MEKQESFRGLIHDIIFNGLDKPEINKNLSEIEKMWNVTSEQNILKGLQLLALLDETIKLPNTIISNLIINILSGNEKIKRASIGVLTSYYTLRPTESFKKHDFCNKLLAEANHFSNQRLTQVLALTNSDQRNYIIGTIISQESNLEEYTEEICCIPKIILLNRLIKNDQDASLFEEGWKRYQQQNLFQTLDVYRDQILKHLIYKKEVQQFGLQGILFDLETDILPLDDIDELRQSCDQNQLSMSKTSMSYIHNILRSSINIRASKNFGLMKSQKISIIKQTSNLIESNNSTGSDDVQIIQEPLTLENDN